MARRSGRGFTLAEVLLAIGTMVLVILTILALVISLNRGSRKTVDVAAAHLVADQVLTTMVDLAQKNFPAGQHTLFWDNDYAPPGLAYKEGSVITNGTEFFYRMDATTVRDAITGVAVGDNLTFNKVKLVTAEVHWWNPVPTPAQQRAGYGKLSVQAVRLVHEQTF